MQVDQISNIIRGEVLSAGNSAGNDIHYAFSSDLMSDVPTRDYEDTVLITGLSSIQAIRTAEMSDIGMVIIAQTRRWVIK